MTVLPAARAAFVALVTAALPDVTVSAVPLGEDEPALEAVYLESWKNVFTWRSLGSAARNRRETITLDIVVRTYREAGDQRDAATAAVARNDEMLEAVEAAVVDGPAPMQISGTVSWARIAGWRTTPEPRAGGWTVISRAKLEAEHLPA